MMLAQRVMLLLLSSLSALFAAAVMSYIAMAVPIGPWVEATLVLLLSIIMKVTFQSIAARGKMVALSTFSGGIAGIAATGCAFSFPTLFFLDKNLFNSLLSDPFYFSCVLGGLVFTSGSIGLLVAHVFRKSFIEDSSLSFPIGIMVQKIIVAQDQTKKSTSLITGAIAGSLFLVLQKPLLTAKAWIPKTITLMKKNIMSFDLGSYRLPISSPSFLLNLSIFPLLISVGFIAGYLITLPLIAGAFSKTFILEPLQALFFTSTRWNDFVLAFCSGMVLEGAVVSFLGLPKVLASGKKNLATYGIKHNFDLNVRKAILVGAILALYCSYMWFIGMPYLAMPFLLIGTLICAYQLCVIGGKIGLAPLGRFATFIMIPGVLLFGASPLLATTFATFVEVAGGVAVDALFGYKTAQLMSIENKEVVRFQWLGLIVTSLVIGFIFYFVIGRFGLGSQELFAQKAQTRAMLLHIYGFDYRILVGGMIFGWVLKKLKLNPMFVLTGILMPLDYSFGLIAGGLLARLVSDSETLTPFFSGVFCANSLWIVLSAFWNS